MKTEKRPKKQLKNAKNHLFFLASVSIAKYDFFEKCQNFNKLGFVCECPIFLGLSCGLSIFFSMQTCDTFSMFFKNFIFLPCDHCKVRNFFEKMPKTQKRQKRHLF